MKANELDIVRLVEACPTTIAQGTTATVVTAYESTEQRAEAYDLEVGDGVLLYSVSPNAFEVIEPHFQPEPPREPDGAPIISVHIDPDLQREQRIDIGQVIQFRLQCRCCVPRQGRPLNQKTYTGRVFSHVPEHSNELIVEGPHGYLSVVRLVNGQWFAGDVHW